MSFSKPVNADTWSGKSQRNNSLSNERGKFNPRIPTISIERNIDEELVWADYPDNLKKRLSKKSQKITEDCLKENAEAILKFYEKDIIEYVASQQIKSNKTVKRLIMRDHAKEKEDPNRYAREAGTKLASSSFLVRNPFGDLPMDPALMYEEEESSDTDAEEPREEERLAEADAQMARQLRGTRQVTRRLSARLQVEMRMTWQTKKNC